MQKIFIHSYFKNLSLCSHPKIIKDLIDYTIKENHTNLEDLENAAK